MAVDQKLLKLLKFGDCPTCIYIDLVNGKHYRKKYSTFNSFLSACRKDHFLMDMEVEDVFSQKSLLDDKIFIMVYAHEKG